MVVRWCSSKPKKQRQKAQETSTVLPVTVVVSAISSAHNEARWQYQDSYPIMEWELDVFPKFKSGGLRQYHFPIARSRKTFTSWSINWVRTTVRHRSLSGLEHISANHKWLNFATFLFNIDDQELTFSVITGDLRDEVFIALNLLLGLHN